MLTQKWFRIFLAAVLTLGISGIDPGTAEAVIYSWTDDSGKKHFTTDKAKIPRKFRKRKHIKTTGRPEAPPKKDAPSAGGPGGGGLEVKKGKGSVSEGDGGGAGQAEKKEDDKNPYSPAQIQLIKDSFNFAKRVKSKYQRVMKSSDRNNQEAKWYFLVAGKMQTDKKALLPRINAELQNLPFLVGLAEFLEEYSEYPFSMIGKGDDVLVRLNQLISRMNEEIQVSENIKLDIEREMARIVKQVGQDIFASKEE